MKKIFSLLGLLLTLNTIAGERSALLIKFVSGEEAVVQTGTGALELKQSYDHVGGIFLLSVNQTSYEFGEIIELRFQKGPTSVELLEQEPVTDRLSFTLADRKITVDNVTPEGVEVYSLDGKSVPAVISSEGGSVSIDLSSCIAGHYIIRVNAKTIKVCIR